MPDNVAQIASITSESLQAKVRQLLPSQQGFGHDLQASNVIIPVIDLTNTATGGILPSYLQTSLAFGSQTAFSEANGTTVVANTPGFYRIIGTATVESESGQDNTTSFTMTDGLSVKTVWSFTGDASAGATSYSTQFDFNVYLTSGDSISVVSNSQGAIIGGSSRQIADVNGNLVNPSGFVSQ